MRHRHGPQHRRSNRLQSSLLQLVVFFGFLWVLYLTQDAWLLDGSTANAVRVISLPNQQQHAASGSTDQLQQPRLTQAVDAFGWRDPQIQTLIDLGYLSKDNANGAVREHYVQTKHEYEIPEEYKEERRAYHKGISAPLIDQHFLRSSLFRHSEPLCPLLGDDVAIVGNGPLSEEQRMAIQNSSCIIRFNALRNRLPGERTDLWVLRYNERPPTWYWGISSVPVEEVADVVGSTKGGIVFLGGTKDHVTEAMGNYPAHLPPDKAIHFPIDQYGEQYFELFGYRSGEATMPSSGLLGILMVLGCMQEEEGQGRQPVNNAGSGAGGGAASGGKGERGRRRVNIYGFNWSDGNSAMHVMYVESYLVELLKQRYGNIYVHATPCAALHSCEQRSKRAARAQATGGGGSGDGPQTLFQGNLGGEGGNVVSGYQATLLTHQNLQQQEQRLGSSSATTATAAARDGGFATFARGLWGGGGGLGGSAGRRSRERPPALQGWWGWGMHRLNEWDGGGMAAGREGAAATAGNDAVVDSGREYYDDAGGASSVYDDYDSNPRGTAKQGLLQQQEGVYAGGGGGGGDGLLQ